MKKTLIAIAAIAAVGAASAQVTLYGKLDVGVSTSTSTDSSVISQGAQIGSSNYEGSRIGVKGSSDIAPGIKGMFQVEGGLNSTDGTFEGFGRNAWLGLSGSFGTVSAGRIWTPYDSAFNDALEYNGFSAMGSAFYGGIHGDNGMDGSGASKSGIQYATPAMGGLSAVVMYGSNANATADMAATNYTSVGVNYANGPLAVNLATEKVASAVHNGAAVTDDSYTNAWILAASYNLGVATVFAAAEGATADDGYGTSAKDAGTGFGVSIPVNKATTVALGYASETTSAPGYSDGKKTSTGVQVVYAWNAATAIYAGYRKTDTTLVGYTDTTGSTKFATGIRYNF